MFVELRNFGLPTEMRVQMSARTDRRMTSLKRMILPPIRRLPPAAFTAMLSPGHRTR